MTKKSIRLLALTLIAVMLFAIPASAATAIMPGVKINEKKNSRNYDYGMNIGFETKCKFNKTGYWNATLLLPLDLMTKGNAFAVTSRLNLHDASIQNGDNFIGNVPSDYIFIEINKNGKIAFTRRRGYDGKKMKMGKASVSIKKSEAGPFYILTIKNMTYDSKYFPRDAEWEPKNQVKIDKTKTYEYSQEINLSSWGNKLKKKVNSYMYLVSSSAKTAKPLEYSFEEFNFRYFDAWKWSNNKESRPARRIANVTY